MKFQTVAVLMAALSTGFVNAAPVDEAAVVDAIEARAEAAPFPGTMPSTGGDNPWDCGALFCPKERRDGGVEGAVNEAHVKREENMAVPIHEPNNNPWECGALFCHKEKRDGAASPEAVMERDEVEYSFAKRQISKCWQAADGQVHCNVDKRQFSNCWEAADGQIHCNKEKRAPEMISHCWEAPDGQVHCQMNKRIVLPPPLPPKKAPKESPKEDAAVLTPAPIEPVSSAPPGAGASPTDDQAVLHPAPSDPADPLQSPDEPSQTEAPVSNCSEAPDGQIQCKPPRKREAEPQEDSPYNYAFFACRHDPTTGACEPDLAERDIPESERNRAWGEIEARSPQDEEFPTFTIHGGPNKFLQPFHGPATATDPTPTYPIPAAYGGPGSPGCYGP